MRLLLAVLLILVAGVGGAWYAQRPRGTPVAPPAPAEPPALPAPSASSRLLDLLAAAAQARDAEKAARYTQALSALGPEALPEIRKRLAAPDLPTEVLAACAAALAEAGGEQALPDLRAFWDSPRGEGLQVRRPLVLALAKRRSPEAGRFLVSLWLKEPDTETQTLLAQAIKANPQVNGPLLSKAWEGSRDESQRKRLQALMAEIGSQAHQQEEARTLSALPAGAPGTLSALREVLSRPGLTNKSLAIGLLEREGALEPLLAYAKGREADPGLRLQALTAYCRKGGSPEPVEAWFAEASPGVRSDILNAVGQGAHPAFLPFVDSLGEAGRRARDQIVMAENRRKVGLKP